MKKIVNFCVLVIALASIIFGNSVTFGFAFWDDLQSLDSQTINVGIWNIITESAVVDFEDFTNTDAGYIYDLFISGIQFDIFNTVVGNSVDDLYYGTKSARLLNHGYLSTVNYYTGISTFDFSEALSLDSGKNGSKKYQLFVSNNDTDFVEIDNGIAQKDTALMPHSIDVASILAGGVSMIDGSTADATTPLKYRLLFYSTSSNGVNALNVDDLNLT